MRESRAVDQFDEADRIDPETLLARNTRWYALYPLPILLFIPVWKL